jgi:hypothetical protein
MKNSGVLIDRLQLNIPGLSREERDRLEKELPVMLARYMPQSIPERRCSVLHLRLRIAQGTAKEHLAEMIARQILAGLR